MNANPKFLAATAHVDDAAVKPLPNSRKIYIGPLRVPMREVSQADTPSMFGGEPNPPIYVYDCSGPYTDPAAKIDIRSGLAPLRAKIAARRATRSPFVPDPPAHQPFATALSAHAQVASASVRASTPGAPATPASCRYRRDARRRASGSKCRSS